MRFAWIRSTRAPDTEPVSKSTDQIVLFLYNLVWWIPVFATVTGLVSYRAGLLGFLVITAIRATVNVYRNNAMPVDVAMDFPLRIP